MDSTRSMSVSSAGYNQDDFHSDELNDHRHQPHSLPARHSFSDLRPGEEEGSSTASGGSSSSDAPSDVLADRTDEPISNFGIDPILSGRARAHSHGGSTTRPQRSMSKSSCAVSEHSVDSANVEGILLNRQGSQARKKSTGDEQLLAPTQSRRRRLTRSSVASNNDDDECGSRVSLESDKKEEDVCFPMIKNELRTGIDFAELDEFSVEHRYDTRERNYYKPCISHIQPNSRPLVPQGFGNRNTDLSDSTKVSHAPYNTEYYNEKVSSSEELPPFTSDANIENGKPFTMDRFSFFASESDDTIHAPDLASLVDEGQSFSELFNSSNGTWWLDIMDPTDAEMRTISKAFGIHPLTAEDIKTQEAREKVELFKSYYFVCFHTFDSDHESEDFLDSINMHMVVFKDGILSFHFNPVQHPANVRRRIRQLQDYVNVSSDWICYALIDDITDSFAPIIREIEVETDIIEDSVFVARECDFGRMLRRIGEARKKVMSLMRLLFGKADVIKMFAKRCNERWDNAPRGEIGLYLGDIQDHIVTMYQNLAVYEKIFSRSHGNYLAQLQVESVNSNNRVTKVLGRVTLVGTVIVPLNIITGLFGMNVTVPGQDQGNVKWFFGIVGFMLLVIIILSLIARRWLGEAEEDVKVKASNTAQSIKSSTASIMSKGSRFAKKFT